MARQNKILATHACDGLPESVVWYAACIDAGEKKKPGYVNAALKKNNGLFALLAGVFILSLLATGLTGSWYFTAIPFVILLFCTGWQNGNIVFLLLILSIPFSFEYSFSPSLGTDIPDEGLMLLVSFLFTAYWIYKPASISRNAWRHPLTVLLLTGMGWLVVSTVLSTGEIVSLKILLAKSWYLGAFVLAPLIVFREKKWIKIVIAGLGVSMLAVVLIALRRHASYDFTFATINKSVAPFFRNHVNYSSMLVCVIPLFFAFHHLSSRKDMRALIRIAIIILLAALFFSYARGAWLALALGIVAVWLIKRKLLFGLYIITIIVAIGSVFWLKSGDRYLRFAHDYKTTIFHEKFKEHLVATYQLKDVSTAERFYRWIAGVRMIKDKWLTGFGPGTFYDNYRPYGVPAFKTWVSDNKEHSTVHNYFLLFAIEQGIPGLIFFLLLLGAMFYYAQYLYHRVKNVFYKIVALTAGVILVMITTVNFLSDLVETDKVGSLFFLCLAVLLATDINTRKESESSPHIQRVS
jgi:O-antigen ligase